MIAEYIIHIGSNDLPSEKDVLDVAAAKQIDLLDSFGQLSHGINPILEALEKLGIAPSETAVDLLALASMVFAADTSFDRRRLAEDGWTRQFLIHMPVRDPELWQAASSHLARMLKFLTGDFWEFKFRNRPTNADHFIKHQGGFNFIDFDTVSLFSGGLDSLIGAVDLLETGKSPLFISHSKDKYASNAQTKLAQRFAEAFSDKTYEFIRAPIGVSSADLPSAGSDDNQRARSFLFYSMATLVTEGMEGTCEVLIPENGLIALNIPLEPFRLGSLSTRTAHPFFIDCMNRLTEQLNLKTRYRNPYQFKTKGEMSAGCKNLAFLQAVTSDSMSCSAPDKGR